jgi:hypothetical protein
MLGAAEGVTMTEAEWLACKDQWELWRFLRDKADDRKKLLFAAACCRRVWPHLSRAESRAAVETAERLADGFAGKEDRIRARKAAKRVLGSLEADELRSQAAAAAHDALEWFDGRFDGGDVLYYVPQIAGILASRKAGLDPKEAWYTGHQTYRDAYLAEGAALADVLRDLLGPLPFRLAPAVRPRWLSWNDGAVTKMAQAIYAERLLPAGELEPARLAVMADALEEAGCSNPEVLAHLRSPGPHVRGCWVVDLLLGKT